ncbi:MAG: metallophosphoesterase family protein, partial [Candidatus Ornithospirochaeta sp.]
EKMSHEELKAMFSRLEKNGTKVFVLMGNHDTGRTPYALLSDSVAEAEGISPMEAEELWMEYGYGEAVSKDPQSNSYLAAISDDIWLIALDTNNGSGGSVRKKTLAWMENALKMAEIKGKKVISATHQNLFIHNPRYTFGYQINNSSQVVSLYKKYGVSLNLSGHLHIQHIAEENGIVDISAESFSDWPLQYGIITINDDYSYTYCTKELDDQRLIMESLLAFDSSTESKFSTGIDDEKMLDLAKVLNREYFRGYVDDYDTDALEKWRNRDDLRMSGYIVSIAGDRNDYRTYSGRLK